MHYRSENSFSDSVHCLALSGVQRRGCRKGWHCAEGRAAAAASRAQHGCHRQPRTPGAPGSGGGWEMAGPPAPLSPSARLG